MLPLRPPTHLFVDMSFGRGGSRYSLLPLALPCAIIEPSFYRFFLFQRVQLKFDHGFDGFPKSNPWTRGPSAAIGSSTRYHLRREAADGREWNRTLGFCACVDYEGSENTLGGKPYSARFLPLFLLKIRAEGAGAAAILVMVFLIPTSCRRCGELRARMHINPNPDCALLFRAQNLGYWAS